MELNGQAITDFWIWFLAPEQQKTYKTESLIKYNKHNTVKIMFLADSFSQRWGVFVDFFDAHNICIEICKMHLFEYYYWMINDGSEQNKHETRHKARLEAIEEASKLYNKAVA